MEKSTFGQRLKLAFQNANNAQIARKIGVSDSAVTNYMAGRVPDIEKLTLIKSLTNCGLDWLLTGDGPQFVDSTTEDTPLRSRLRTIAAEQAHVVFADAEIAGGNLEQRTLELLTTYLLNRALHSFNLLPPGEWLMSAQERKRAEKFTFVKNVPESIEDRIQDIVRNTRFTVDTQDGLRDIIRELIQEELGERTGKVRVIDHDFGEGKQKARKTG